MRDGDGRMFVVRVATPPLYLLYRAREESSEGVHVYARRHATSRVYCAWGTSHPLASLLEDRLNEAGRNPIEHKKARLPVRAAGAIRHHHFANSRQLHDASSSQPVHPCASLCKARAQSTNPAPEGLRPLAIGP